MKWYMDEATLPSDAIGLYAKTGWLFVGAADVRTGLHWYARGVAFAAGFTEIA